MILFELLYLALPAFVANMMPVIATRYNIAPFLNRPVDGGVMYRGKPLLGINKTWRGVFAAVCGSTLTVIIQYFEKLPLNIITVAYESLFVAILYGICVGLLVILGDALGSFIKRQFSLRSGSPSIPLDQIDYIVVFIIGTLPFTTWGMIPSITLIVMTFFLNIGTNLGAYVLGIKKTYW